MVHVEYHALFEIQREQIQHGLHVLLFVVGVVRELHPGEDLISEGLVAVVSLEQLSHILVFLFESVVPGVGLGDNVGGLRDDDGEHDGADPHDDDAEHLLLGVCPPDVPKADSCNDRVDEVQSEDVFGGCVIRRDVVREKKVLHFLGRLEQLFGEPEGAEHEMVDQKHPDAHLDRLLEPEVERHLPVHHFEHLDDAEELRDFEEPQRPHQPDRHLCYHVA
mmetsp:Transcript_51385/g.117156  ORF Transcript_51385/g.117156 Transcript_51385/m.117156 type:complete len:220 (+) Transcript_51385:1294-1953(+)